MAVSSSGRIRPTASCASCAEETGLEATLGPIIGVRSDVLEPDETSSGHRIHVVGIVFRATVTGGTLRDEVGGSTDRAAWIPAGELATIPHVEASMGPRTHGPVTMRSSIGIDIAAPPAAVYRLARDVTALGAAAPPLRAVAGDPARRRRCARVRLRRAPGPRPVARVRIPVAWRSRTWHEPATRRLHFHHVAGATRGMDVTWTIEPAGTGMTRVEIAHDFRPGSAPFAGFVDRAFTGPIAGRTLATMKALAEALATGDGAATAPETRVRIRPDQPANA